MILYYAVAAFAAILLASFIRRTKDKYEDFCVGIAIPIFILLLLPFGVATGWLRPQTIDGQLRAIDLALGLDGFALTRWLIETRLYAIVGVVYPALPLVVALAWILERSRPLLKKVVAGAIFASPIYLLFPAAGPQYAFAVFPSTSAHLTPVSIFHPRNCVPSMHFSWALLLALNISNWRWRWIFIAYALLMAFSTVASGEHYFIDVLAAIPFTLAVQKVAQIQGRRSRGPLPAPQSAGVTT